MLLELLNQYSSSPGFVLHLAWSPNGKYLLSEGLLDPIDVWDANSGTHIVAHNSPFPHCLCTTSAWSPDSTRIASSDVGSKGLWVWEAAAGKHLFSSSAQTASYMNRIVWSPDGAFIAAGDGDGKIYVWRASAIDKPVMVYTREGGSIDALAWSPDGTRIACSAGDIIYVWKVKTGKTIWATKSFNPIQDIVWQQNETRIACTDGWVIVLLDAATGEVARATKLGQPVVLSPTSDRIAMTSGSVVNIFPFELTELKEAK